MTLTPQWLDELRSRVTLSGVIGRTTRLTKAGHEFKACCPFHNEKSPSFTVNDDKGFYHCFGCGAHGDAIRWLTDQRGLEFMDAVKELAAEAGMEMPAPDPRAAQAAERRDTLYDVMAAAQAWFVGNLASERGAAARAYLARRGIDAETAERFGFGFAPDERQALKTALSRFPEPMLIEAGLRIEVENRDPYDRFRGRLMLPIQDARARVIAFGGRILDAAKTDAPKYLNSPDTPLFDKGSTLYNLHRAAPLARQSGRMLVVEGYMDAIALAAAGIGECVAPLGTALTERQIELLWRQVESPILCFDGDSAGQRAAMRAVTRALPMLRPAHSLSIVRLPAGLDPDDLVKRGGAAAMEQLLSQPRTMIDMLWQHESDAEPLPTPEAKAGLKARLLAHVETIEDRDIRSMYRRELLDRFSSFAFPPRPPREASVRGFRSQPPVPTRSAHGDQLRRAVGGGARDALRTAVVAGLVRWPAEIGRHAEALAQLGATDSRFTLLLDAFEDDAAVEAEGLMSILASNGYSLPLPDDQVTLRLPFLIGTDPDRAIPALREAMAILIEMPVLASALSEATERFDLDGQARIRSRREELEGRLKALLREQLEPIAKSDELD